jgi:hypothetical protein
MMYVAKLKLAAALVVAATVVTGGGVAVYQVTDDNGANAAPAATVAQVDPAEPAAKGAVARKPMPPMTAGVSQTPIIVVGTVQASRVVANSERLPSGTWTLPRTRVAARVTEIIKGYAAPVIEFDVLGLGFESGKSYVLLLDQEQLEVTDRFGKRKVVGLVWSPAVKRRVEATPENVAIIKRAADAQQIAHRESEPAAGAASFRFNSGMSLEFGQWDVKLSESGRLTMQHSFRGRVKSYDPVTLRAAENKEVWQLIHAADIPNRESLTRPGIPGEVSFTFELDEEGREHEFRQWETDAMKVSELKSLVGLLGAIIARETGSSKVWFAPSDKPNAGGTD